MNGVAVGAGFGLVLASDIVVASKDAKFGTPELKRGLFPFLILEMLKKHFMPKIVNELVLMGKILTAEKLKSLEFVNYLCKDKQGLEKLSLEKAEQIAGYNFEVTQLGKKLLIEDNRDKISNLEQALINNLNMLEVRENLKAFVK